VRVSQEKWGPAALERGVSGFRSEFLLRNEHDNALDPATPGGMTAA
jgi:hypothetical protein